MPLIRFWHLIGIKVWGGGTGDQQNLLKHFRSCALPYPSSNLKPPSPLQENFQLVRVSRVPLYWTEGSAFYWCRPLSCIHLDPYYFETNLKRLFDREQKLS